MDDRRRIVSLDRVFLRGYRTLPLGNEKADAIFGAQGFPACLDAMSVNHPGGIVSGVIRSQRNQAVTHLLQEEGRIRTINLNIGILSGPEIEGIIDDLHAGQPADVFAVAFYGDSQIILNTSTGNGVSAPETIDEKNTAANSALEGPWLAQICHSLDWHAYSFDLWLYWMEQSSQGKPMLVCQKYIAWRA